MSDHSYLPPLLTSKWRVPLLQGLSRGRLVSVLGDLWAPGLGLVVAPAGSGKTTLLAQVAAAADVPVAWYTAESSESEVPSMLRYLEASIRSVLPDVKGDWTTVEEAAAALSGAHRRTLLILDDLQTLSGSPAEPALGRLLRFFPPTLGVLAGSRTTPAFNLSRLRLDGALREVSADDLRFRAWEVEQLFSEIYNNPLRPEELARLARRTNGWAAGLHLFHLATRGRSAEERRTKLDTLAGSSKLVREYLTDNVLADLPHELREFLVNTCVLGRLSSNLCDRLLDIHNSSHFLIELEERQLFLSGNEDEGYRCHDVLRAHLEAILMQEKNEAEFRELYLKAGILLEGSGAHADALYSYCRAEEWLGVGRLLAHDGALFPGNSGPWMDLIPPALALEDPWMLLWSARRQRFLGKWEEAMDLYSKAESAFHSQSGMDISRSERLAISEWLSRPLGRLSGWDGLIRMATMAIGSGVQTVVLPGVRGRVASGVTALLAGNVAEAAAHLSQAAKNPNASMPLALGARLACEVARLLQGFQEPGELEIIIEEADFHGLSWLAMMSRAALALTDREDGLKQAMTVRMFFIGQSDLWGRSLAALLEGMGAVRRGEDSDAVLKSAAEDFRSVGATTLEGWCLCTHALALSLAHDPNTLHDALIAESVAKSARLSGPLSFVYQALSEAQPHRAKEHLGLAAQTGRAAGLRLLVRTPSDQGARHSGSVPVLIRCFGEFQVSVHGTRLDLKAIKPRSRQLFRLLAMNVPNSVHREVIGDALWPDADPDIIRRNLQVAVHSVRRLLQGVTAPSAQSILTRNGDSYRLDLPQGSVVDLREFERSLADGKLARAQKDHQRAAEAFEKVLDLHDEDLFIEDGPAEWVVMERERCRSQAVEAAQSLADIHLESGDLDSAAQTCERGLRLDRYQDSLWRRLVEAHRRAGNRAAENKAKKLYKLVLADLGLVEQSAI